MLINVLTDTVVRHFAEADGGLRTPGSDDITLAAFLGEANIKHDEVVRLASVTISQQSLSVLNRTRTGQHIPEKRFLERPT